MRQPDLRQDSSPLKRPWSLGESKELRQYLAIEGRDSSQSKRPATIAELVERVRDNLWDENKDLNHYLQVAGEHRRDGKEFVRTGDLENAFVQFARAATLVLKLPQHRDYYTVLNPAQRHNLALVRVYQPSGLGVSGYITLLEEYCCHLTGSARQIIYVAMSESIGIPHGEEFKFCSLLCDVVPNGWRD